MIIYILLAIVLFVGFLFVFAYNGFIKKINQVKEAWADIDVQLKRRYDLIPNLVNTVKGYASHESETFAKVTEARAMAMKAGNLAEKSQTENILTDTLKSLFAVSEAYPELKANENFLSLQTELSDTENKIQSARRFYNGNVRDLNIAIDSFPQNIIAGMFHFLKMEYFELEQDNAAKEAVEVKF
ncbi:MAG: LemA family protein [Minisyncoccia bacterium]